MSGTKLALTSIRQSSIPDRIAVNLVERDGHWIWTGQVNNKGYGAVYAKYPAQPSKKADKRPVHLVVWEHLVGLVAIGYELDHCCKFKLCANPSCLEEVTHAENQRRIGERLTHCRKQQHPRTTENVYRNPKTGRTRCRPCEQEREAHRPPRRRKPR